MKTQIQAFGENMCIILPNEITKEFQLQIGADIDIDVLNNKIQISNLYSYKKEVSLDEMLQNINESNLHEEVETNFVVGNELC